MPAATSAIPANHQGGPSFVLEISELQTAVRSLGIDVAIFEVRRAENFARAFAALKGRVEAVYVVSDPRVWPSTFGNCAVHAAAGGSCIDHSASDQGG